MSQAVRRLIDLIYESIEKSDKVGCKAFEAFAYICNTEINKNKILTLLKTE